MHTHPATLVQISNPSIESFSPKQSCKTANPVNHSRSAAVKHVALQLRALILR